MSVTDDQKLALVDVAQSILSSDKAHSDERKWAHGILDMTGAKQAKATEATPADHVALLKQGDTFEKEYADAREKHSNLQDRREAFAEIHQRRRAWAEKVIKLTPEQNKAAESAIEDERHHAARRKNQRADLARRMPGMSQDEIRRASMDVDNPDRDLATAELKRRDDVMAARKEGARVDDHVATLESIGWAADMSSGGGGVVTPPRGGGGGIREIRIEQDDAGKWTTHAFGPKGSGPARQLAPPSMTPRDAMAHAVKAAQEAPRGLRVVKGGYTIGQEFRK